MKTLSELEVGVQHNLKDSGFSITGAAQLEVCNRITRGLCSAFPFSELRRANTATTTQRGVSAYEWPTTEKWVNVTVVEIQNGDDGNKYEPVYPAVTERTWSAKAGENDRAVPDLYLRYSTDTGQMFDVRPPPKYASKIIRITGIVEPDDYQDGNSRTPFLLKTVDDALEHLIAADWFYHDGQSQWSQEQLAKAGDILGSIYGKEKVPAEMLRTIATG